MKNKLYRNLFAVALTLLVALAFAACTPTIHIHTDGSSTKESTTGSEAVAPTEDKASQDTPASKEETVTSVDEEPKTSTPKKEESTASKQTSSKETVSKTTSSKASSSTITKSKAKSIALKDAGLKESQVYDFEIDLDYDNGVRHYEVSFEYKNKDYSYDIDAKTGKILSVDKPNATSNEVKISKDKAKSVALNHAGVKAADVRGYEVELEKENGVWKYEISFEKGNKEYEYEIDAATGKVLYSHSEFDD